MVGKGSVVRLFADDTIIYNRSDNHDVLQEDLRRLEKWELEWDMEFHPLKCQHMTFSRKTSPPVHTFSLHATEIPKAESVKYLGAFLDSKLKWHKHVSQMTAKTDCSLGFIRRNIITRSSEVKARAYKQLARPLLEYASGAWDSLTKTQEVELEAVQRRAARLVCNIGRTDRQTSTTGLLQKLDWETLEARRRERRLRVFSEYHFSEEGLMTSYMQPHRPTTARRHLLQYPVPHCNTQHHQRSFFMKTARKWNDLPTTSPYLIKTVKSLNH
jgi:hypothetical protein